MPSAVYRFAVCFNPRTHMGCDTRKQFGILHRHEFQSTHPHGVRLAKRVFKVFTKSFNPRTHMGCDIIVPPTLFGKLQFQSTHPHGVRQPKALQTLCKQPVSIHAPTWGATSAQLNNLSKAKVSIHAPTWGATRQRHQENPLADVSIHAPTWGAIQILFTIHWYSCVSIHAPTWGATFRGLVTSCVKSSFNPRTHMGCDAGKAGSTWHMPVVSIHAPTWGATQARLDQRGTCQ